MDNLQIDNTPISAIGATGFKRDNVEINEKPLPYVYQLMVFPQFYDEVNTQIQQTFGFELPKIGELTENQSTKCFSSQPNKWLLVADNPLSELATLCDNNKSAYVDLSSAYVGIEVSGEGATQFLQQLCFVDLSTDFATITTQLASDYNGILEKQANGFVVYITRSLAKSFWDYLKVV